MTSAPTSFQCDIIILGGGVAGAWLAARLLRLGFSVLAVENRPLGGARVLTDDLALLQDGGDLALAWQDCLQGRGDVDLRAAASLADRQLVWQDKGCRAAVAGGVRIKPAAAGDVFAQRDRKYKGKIFTRPVLCPDMAGVAAALAGILGDRYVAGTVSAVLPDGQVAVAGQALRARVVIAVGPDMHEKVLRLMRVAVSPPPPRRLVFVRGVAEKFFGRSADGFLCCSSYFAGDGYVRVLGGGFARAAAGMTAEQAVAAGCALLTHMFGPMDWDMLRWFAQTGPAVEDAAADADVTDVVLHQRGQVLTVRAPSDLWAPRVAAKVEKWLMDRGCVPGGGVRSLPALPQAMGGDYPWRDGYDWLDIAEIPLETAG